MKTALFPVVAWCVGLALTPAAAPAQTNPAPMVVHEWGTFTSLQNEAGQSLGGINTDDEPVPQFVHRLQDFLLLGPTEVPGIFFQGAPHCHPDVTMRLETPVLYFHPPKSQPAAHGITVTAQFRGGWLSEYYPNAGVNAPGLTNNRMQFGPLSSHTVSTLQWSNLDVGGDWAGPATSQHVWLSPRAVSAASVRTPSGEAEKFLFYRGVAHLDPPLAVSQDADTAQLTLRSQCPPEIAGHAPWTLKSLWLVDIKPNGALAFRTLPPITLEAQPGIVATVSGHFTWFDYHEANRLSLKESLRAALVSDGLFDDEAQALLNTWELSYFKSPGLRLFFLLPRAWTDSCLPLKISPTAELTRVMVGRIELVTPAQRKALRQLANFSPAEIETDAQRLHADFYARIADTPDQLQAVNTGRESLAAFGISVPKSYQLYLGLGRFRNALVLEEAKARPTPGLASFISSYNLEGYHPLQLSAAALAR